MSLIEMRTMTPLGTHVGCGGAVVLIQRPAAGYRLCIECGKRAGEVALVQEQPAVAPTQKVALSRRMRAFQYVSKLKVGYVIDEKEERAIDEFAIYLQAALLHYGLDIEKVVGGWKVIERLTW